MLRYALSVLLLLLTTILLAQDSQELRYEDYIYQDNIYSVRLSIGGLPLSLPIVDMSSGAVIRLEFDDTDANVQNYVYEIVHCDMHWKPTSTLSEFDYLVGNRDNIIRTAEASYGTIFAYTHYTLDLPDNNYKWTKSGNYLLKILESDAKTLVLTRRFMVVENLGLAIKPRMNFTADVSKIQTHQEIDFSIEHKNVKINNPMAEVNAVIFQNGNWQNTIKVKPFSYVADEISFDWQNKVVFPAGKEFRYLDIRSLRSRIYNVKTREERDDAFYLTLLRDRDDSSNPYVFTRDANGNCVTYNLDLLNLSLTESIVADIVGNNARTQNPEIANIIKNPQADAELRSDYAYVLFSLEAVQPYEGKDVYIVGRMSDWQPYERFKMNYIEQDNAYKVDALLKQGYYNYRYALVDAKGEIDMETLEGNWFEAENSYTVAIYYRPFGSRYDRLIAVDNFNSADVSLRRRD